MRLSRFLFFRYAFISSGLLVGACLEPFNPSIEGKDLNLLVVDGYINAGPGKTRIVLSKVSPLGISDRIFYETDAEVSIQTESNEIYLLNESNPGTYESAELNLPLDGKYKLHIILKSGKEYSSGLMAVKITPPIDSISWEWKPDWLYLYVNAHDDAASTRNYRWTFEETWQIRSPELIRYKYENDTINPTTSQEMIAKRDCWQSGRSSRLIFATTEKLIKDEIKFPIQKISHASDRISVRYSILVRQHTVTTDEFNYITLMEKNSTEIGSFFDPMPSRLYGNIKPARGTDEAIGYVGVYTTEEKRIYINNEDLPEVFAGLNCSNDVVDFIFNTDSLNFYFGANIYTPTSIYVDPFTNTVRVSGMSSYCFDCTLRGSLIVPDFWE